jgi:hypothetical protein
MQQPQPESHSPKVRIQLFVAGLTLSVSHAGGGSLIVRDPIDVEPTEARLVVAVDDKEYLYDVRLDKGIAHNNKVVPYTKIEEPIPF